MAHMTATLVAKLVKEIAGMTIRPRDEARPPGRPAAAFAESPE
jgi:hypothetical protein